MGFGLNNFGDKVEIHKVKTEAEWHILRSQCVTASNAAVLVGCNPYSSPNKLRNPEPFEGNAFTLTGQVLEPVVVDVTNRVLGTNFKLYEQEKDEKVFYTESYLGATPDAVEGDILLECKSTRPHTFLKYSGYPPLNYLVQTQVQMECTGLDLCYLSILSTNLTQKTAEIKWPITIFKIWKNQELCDILQEEAKRFTENETFRVKSKYKKKVKLLLSTCYERIL